MPWQPDGTFERVNPDFQGPTVWEQDQQVPIKIIASRHDFHDEDLAQGIAASLNLDGFNAMRAALDMGGFQITNVANGALDGDAATVGQVIASATFDEGTRVLTLVKPNAPDVTVTIPSGSGGGGEGTVTSISLADGLEGTSNPINVSGTISLETIGVEQTFAGPLSSITIDKHGRVTQVVAGSLTPGTNLGFVLFASSVRITSSTGTNATIPAATTTQAGVMSAADKQKLNSVSANTGSWTPAAFNLGDASGNSGTYSRIGNLVFVTGRYRWVSNTGSASALQIRGLPFTVDPAAEFFIGSYIPVSGFNGPTPGNIDTNQPDTQNFIAARFIPGEDYLQLSGYSPVNAENFPDQILDYSPSLLETTGEVLFSGAYITNDP